MTRLRGEPCARVLPVAAAPPIAAARALSAAAARPPAAGTAHVMFAAVARALSIGAARLHATATAGAIALGGAGLTITAALATPPPEVTGDRFTNKTTLAWNPVGGTGIDYNVYRGQLSGLRSGVPAQCHGDEVTATSFTTPAVPAAADGYFYLVTAENAAGEEGTPGTTSASVTRTLLGTCDKVMRNHVLDRLGYGS